MPKEKPASEYPFYDIPGPIAIVHRGGDAHLQPSEYGHELETSLRGIEEARQRGITYVETDALSTRDQVSLASHGSRNLARKRLSGLPLRAELQDMYLDEVRKLRVHGEPISTLEEILTTFPGMRFFIDPKTPESVEPLGELIKRLKVQDRVSIGAFSYKRTKAAAEIAGGQRDVCTSLAKWGAFLLSLSGTASRHFLENTSASSLQIPHFMLTKKMIERAHDLGIHVIVWPGSTNKDDDRSYMNTALNKGAHGLMSDHTDEMIDVFLEHDPDNQSIRR